MATDAPNAFSPAATPHVSDTVFVTGGTGQTGSNVCQQLIMRGDAVRAMIRDPDDAVALADIGVEV
jgi:dihydroflavonol-4-reductase